MSRTFDNHCDATSQTCVGKPGPNARADPGRSWSPRVGIAARAARIARVKLGEQGAAGGAKAIRSDEHAMNAPFRMSSRRGQYG
jgi:hypothetical protein